MIKMAKLPSVLTCVVMFIYIENVAADCSSTDGFCNDPGVPLKGQRFPSYATCPDGFPHGETVQYSCDVGYRMVDGSGKMVCGQDSEWSPPVRPKCEEIRCLPPPVEHARLNPELDEYAVGTTVYVSCQFGYRPEPSTSNKLECRSTRAGGVWAPASGSHTTTSRTHLPRCVPICSLPSTILNGNYNTSRPDQNGEMALSSWIEYYCDSMYRLSDVSKRRRECILDGFHAKWSGEEPSCVPESTDDDSDEVSMFISTKIIAIATAASVLGVLIVVLIVVVVQRRSAFYQRLHQPDPRRGGGGGSGAGGPGPASLGLTTAPGGPSTVVVTHPCTVSLDTDDPDRMALIAYADGIPVVLPSYDEAVGRGMRGPALATGGSSGGVRLQPGGPGRRGNPRPDAVSIVSNNSGSIRSGARGVRQAACNDSLGSTQTVNTVNSSEVSTAVTVDTTDTGSSVSPSVRAACGSLASSTDSLTNTEGAPLLDVNDDDGDSKKTNFSEE